ncbi:hypothetical protein Q3V23_35090 [Streptomyces sp. VNUA116]|nr:hypothetical protein [Streptomyces sp. VNUA116]WKU48871.1 hypothetical protein Q3V23_35090 [Streptomyces sp. VNUA116]
MATSQKAQSRRDSEDQKTHALIARLATVDGLHHVVTRFSDICAAGSEGSLFESPSSNVLGCDMEAAAYFGVQGDITDVLPRIRAAGIATWGPQQDGQDQPYAGGTIRYALEYHHAHGRYPDGRLMPGPNLTAPGLGIEWDRPQDLPLPNQIKDLVPCPSPYPVYFRCSLTPEPRTSLAVARARYGTILVFTASARDYFTVPRRKRPPPAEPKADHAPRICGTGCPSAVVDGFGRGEFERCPGIQQQGNQGSQRLLQGYQCAART